MWVPFPVSGNNARPGNWRWVNYFRWLMLMTQRDQPIRSYLFTKKWENYLFALSSELILCPDRNKRVVIQASINASSKYIFKSEQYLLNLENWMPLLSPMSPNTHFWNFLIHIYRLMTHLIPVQNTSFSCLAHSLSEMLLGRASTNGLSVLDLFLLS